MNLTTLISLPFKKKRGGGVNFFKKGALFKVFHQYKEQLKRQRCKPVGLKYRAPEQIRGIKQYK
jgi:hypothetical protein